MARRFGLLAALLLTSTMLQGCVENGPAPSSSRTYAADFHGKAQQCDGGNLDTTAGQTTEAAMKMSGGGWCGTMVHQAGPKPYSAGLLTSRPSHGNVLIHQVGDYTRIDYTPDQRFAGTDTFTARLLPGNANVHFTVTVTGP